MYLFLIPLLLGFAFTGASAFTAAYSRRFGEAGGSIVTAVLRNVIGIPLWIVGYVWAWQIPSPRVFSPNSLLATLGWIFIIAGSALLIIGHIYVGMRSHLPSVRDTLVRHGLYAYVRHPIYASGLLILPGLVLLRPSLTVLVVSAIVLAWLYVQARLEEIDLIQRLPQYHDYMRDVPRFIPRLRPVRTARPTSDK
ncbi:MAG: isoprenylcysteine carboxylmethyltransferase family protein [Anaerolineales bacterium]